MDETKMTRKLNRSNVTDVKTYAKLFRLRYEDRHRASALKGAQAYRTIARSILIQAQLLERYAGGRCGDCVFTHADILRSFDDFATAIQFAAEKLDKLYRKGFEG